jgi:6-pyruvoyl-tetrahydropterin synthase
LAGVCPNLAHYEFIAYVIWQRLADALPLTSVRLYEDPELWAEYRGEAMQAYLTVATHFSAAHRLALDHLSFEENSAIYGLCARPTATATTTAWRSPSRDPSTRARG